MLAGTGLLSLALHLDLETVEVHVKPVLAGDLGRQLGWKSVGVVEDESSQSRDCVDRISQIIAKFF